MLDAGEAVIIQTPDGRGIWDPKAGIDTRDTSTVNVRRGARHSSRPFHDDSEDGERDKQHRQRQEHIGKAHHHRLPAHHQRHLLERHCLSIAAEIMEPCRQGREHLGRGSPRPGHLLVQPRQMQVHAVVEHGVECGKPHRTAEIARQVIEARGVLHPLRR